MATRRENGVGSLLRRTQRNENSSPYKRRAPTRQSPPPLASSSSLSSFLSLISAPFRRKPAQPAPPVRSESEASDDDASDGANQDEVDEQGSPDPEQARELGFGPPPKGAAKHTVTARGPGAAATLSQLGRSLQRSVPQPKVLPASTFASMDSESTIPPSTSVPHIAPLDRPRRNVQPAFATVSRASGAKRTRPSFPGGIGSYGGFGSTAEPSPPPFATNGNPLESSFAANRSANTNANGFSFPATKANNSSKPPAASASRALHGKTSSEVLAEFFASKGKAPLTAEERKRVSQLIAESEAEENPEADPYNGVPSFSFLKSSFPATKSESVSPSNSVLGTTFSFNVSASSAGNGQFSTSMSAPALNGAAAPPRRRRPINYGGSSKRSAVIAKAGFTVREHQKLIEKQKQQQKAEENVAPDSSVVGDKRGVRDVEEDGGGKRRRMNDGLGLSAQPSMPSPLRQMSKFDSPPESQRVMKRAMAPSPSSPLAKAASVAPATPSKDTPPTPAKPVSTATPGKPKPRTSIVADVMRDMLAEDKQREKKEQEQGRNEVFANPYDELIPAPAVTVPKVRKPRRASARPAARSEASKRKDPESKPLSLIEKIEQTDVQPKPKKAKTESPAPTIATIQPPTLTFTAPSPKETKPKARHPGPIIEEPEEADENHEIEVIDLDDDERSKPQARPELKIDMQTKSSNGTERTVLLGVPRQRPSFSLHSPARPSPLREMSVPIEDDIEEIEPVSVTATNGAGTATGGFGSMNTTTTGPFGSTAGSFASSTTANPFGSSTNAFGSGSGFGSTSGFGGFGSANTAGAPSGTLASFGFTAPAPAPVPPTAVFSAPLPPPAPTLTPAQLPTPVKDVLKTQSSLFTPSEEKEPAKLEEVKAVEKAKEVRAPKVGSSEVEKPPVSAPTLAPMTEAETKLSAKNLSISSLPSFTFTASVLIPASKVPESADARAAAQLPVSKLPTFTFGSKFVPAPAPAPVQAFNWNAAGMKPPSAPSGDQWKCGTCSCMSPASAAKCTVCEAPKPASGPTPAPAPAPAPAPVQAFNWTAAGIKPPPAPSGDLWKCGTCDCMSPASATKCSVCEAPKPSGASVAPTPSPAPALAPVQAFDWTAAGMKAPTLAGAWACAVCGLQNKSASATKCEVCESPR